MRKVGLSLIFLLLQLSCIAKTNYLLAEEMPDAIQTENLILRVMGIPYINTGENHVPDGAFPGCSLLPSFR